MEQAFQGRPSEPYAQQLRRGLSGSTIKMIAVICMLIDHLAAGVLGRYLTIYGYFSLDHNDAVQVEMWMQEHGILFTSYAVMRMIGRIAFPIYCFLLVEGFQHTGNRLKYAGRLLLFAAVSEVPFDLLFNNSWLEFGYQNVFFKLFLGLAAMMGIQWVEERQELGRILKTAGLFLVIVACMAAAKLLKTDYAAVGVLSIVILYLFRFKKLYQIMAGCIAFFWELTAPLAFVAVALYNGRKGWNMKYFFYLFYPVHLLLIYLLCVILGISGYKAM